MGQVGSCILTFIMNANDQHDGIIMFKNKNTNNQSNNIWE